jgi:hypothetical protein
MKYTLNEYNLEYNKLSFLRLNDTFAAASDKVYQLLVQGRCFSPGTPASFITKTGRHDISEKFEFFICSVIRTHVVLVISLYELYRSNDLTHWATRRYYRTYKEFEFFRYIMATSFSDEGSRGTRREPPTRLYSFNVYFIYHTHLYVLGARVAQWVRSLDLTTHTSPSPIRRQYFRYIMATSFSDEGSRGTRREPPTLDK